MEGNYIGTDTTGTGTLANSGSGLIISGGRSGNTIGGATASEGNTIALNFQDGVRVTGATTIHNSQRGNSIHDNVSGVGIRLASGGNNELPLPTVDFAGSAGGSTCPNCIIDVLNLVQGKLMTLFDSAL